MADGTAIGLHNALKDFVDTDPFTDAACSSTAYATGTSLGNATAGTDTLVLVTIICYEST